MTHTCAIYWWKFYKGYRAFSTGGYIFSKHSQNNAYWEIGFTGETLGKINLNEFCSTKKP